RPDSHISRDRKWKDRWAMARIAPLSSVGAALWQFARRHLPTSVTERLKELLGRRAPGLGKVRLGDFARTRPISWHHGYDRGRPIDRYYIENFLAQNSAEIRGRVLEIGDPAYSREFGSGIIQQDILHVREGHPGATITGDLARPGLLPESAFDCMIVTQTLNHVYDMSAAVRELHRGLRPGGVLLVTVPGVASIDRNENAETWYWSMTGRAVERLFGEVFGKDNVEVTVHGNVFAATCFLHGLAVEEVEEGWLDKFDASYPLIVTVRARRVAD
ncbi:MAG: class I SAM-dependent methyltransferase, partial [Croceibacterium sp.]